MLGEPYLGQYNAEQKCSDREEEPSEEKKSLGLESDQTWVLGESRLPEADPGEDEDEDGRQAAQQVDHHANVGDLNREYQ